VFGIGVFRFCSTNIPISVFVSYYPHGCLPSLYDGENNRGRARAVFFRGILAHVQCRAASRKMQGCIGNIPGCPSNVILPIVPHFHMSIIPPLIRHPAAIRASS
jgi:hypothetical protein